MIDSIKADLFTLKGLVVSLVHVVFVVGVLACYIGFQIYVLGESIKY